MQTVDHASGPVAAHRGAHVVDASPRRSARARRRRSSTGRSMSTARPSDCMRLPGLSMPSTICPLRWFLARSTASSVDLVSSPASTSRITRSASPTRLGARARRRPPPCRCRRRATCTSRPSRPGRASRAPPGRGASSTTRRAACRRRTPRSGRRRRGAARGRRGRRGTARCPWRVKWATWRGSGGSSGRRRDDARRAPGGSAARPARRAAAWSTWPAAATTIAGFT